MAYSQYNYADTGPQSTRQRRPALLHAATLASIPETYGTINEHAYRETHQPAPPIVEARPGLFRRMTDTVSRVIVGQQLPSEPSPYQPSYWTDHAHLTTLLRIWDAMSGVTKPNDPSGTHAKQAKVAATYRRVGRAFPELLHGNVILTPEWVEVVLEQNLRFRAPRPGYFDELGLAASTGLSKGWGPW